jgi:hypothetical protein
MMVCLKCGPTACEFGTDKCVEVLIRTSHLVLVFEKSLLQEDNSSGKAVVFGSFG